MVHRTPQDVFAAQLNAWDKVVENFSQDEFFKKVITSQRDWAKRVGYYVLFNNVDTRLAYEHYFGELSL
jgi:TRAP-type mannitol/chloroaromatic compound transport system substrate-binding protein